MTKKLNNLGFDKYEASNGTKWRPVKWQFNNQQHGVAKRGKEIILAN